MTTKTRPGIPAETAVMHSCGGTFQLRSRVEKVPLRGETVDVEQAFYVCDKCDAERVTAKQAKAAQAAAASKLRIAEGLLPPERILAIRLQYDATQTQMENYLGLGPKTWLRWETGKVLPTKSADNLLRLIERDRSALAYLAELNGHGAGIQVEAAEHTRREINVPLTADVHDRLVHRARQENLDTGTYALTLLTQSLTVVDMKEAVRSCMHHELQGLQKFMTDYWRLETKARAPMEEWQTLHVEQYGTAA
jgi:putative zinc finger/helix-turn-helix YgiT family protein